jgi:hypothetical protein
MAERKPRQYSAIARAARIAFAFVVLNCSAVAGLLALGFRKKVWR